MQEKLRFRILNFAATRSVLGLTKPASNMCVLGDYDENVLDIFYMKNIAVYLNKFVFIKIQRNLLMVHSLTAVNRSPLL